MTKSTAFRSATACCTQLDLTLEARQCLRAGQTAFQFLEELELQRLYVDAVKVLALLMPSRGAIWWGCLCAWEACRPEPPAEVAAALRATVGWVLDPTEANRWAAKEAGEALGMRHPAGCLARAAFWSEGSQTPEELPRATMPHDVPAVTVAGAILLAALERDPLRHEQQYRLFLKLGRQIGRGRFRWAGDAVAPSPVAAQVRIG